MSKHAIPFHDFGGKGPVLHFAHANGFPPQAYASFLEPFQKDFKIIASDFRPLWKTEDHRKVKSWEVFANDLILFLDQQGLKNIIGMGHSLGGVSTLIAAMKRPDLFSKLILLDPVVFDKAFMKIASILPMSLKKKIIPVAKISSNRTDLWNSKKEVFDSWRKKRVFKGFSDEVLENLIQYAIIPDGRGKMTLAYSKEWETQIYITAPLIFKKIKQIKTPMIVVKGEKSDIISEEVWSDWQKAQPQSQFINFPNTGHLLPFEAPEDLAAHILKLISINK